MNVHEFQAKQLFGQFGVPVPRGKEITSPEAGAAWAEELNTPVFVVKAQIHAGGRGKAGGVKITKDKAAVPGLVKELIGKTLVTHQTGPKGREVRRLLIEEGAAIAKELYVSLLVDRDSGWPVFIASTEGGMEIEEVAAHRPEKIIREAIDPAVGFQSYNGRNIAFALGLPAMEPAVVNPFIQMLGNLYRLFMEKNAAMVEINPLVITGDKKLIALDGKVSFDDNALFRHADVQQMRDLHEEDPLEIEAGENNLNYIKLDGNIGCMVNGAGLAMATMDVIKLAGSEPANFLDVGGGATKETVAAGFPDSAEGSEREGHLHQYLRRDCSLRADCPWCHRSGQRSEDQRAIGRPAAGDECRRRPQVPGGVRPEAGSGERFVGSGAKDCEVDRQGGVRR